MHERLRGIPFPITRLAVRFLLAERARALGWKCGKHRHVHCGSTRMLAHLGYHWSSPGFTRLAVRFLLAEWARALGWKCGKQGHVQFGSTRMLAHLG
jgi:hypothetical protein